MKTVKIIEGVVAEYNGKYWGKQLWDNMDFGELEMAEISSPEFCKKPTDKTSKKQTSHYNALSKAKLVTIKKKITTEFEILT